MSTQHPDNATLPFFADGPVVEGEDEIREAYYVYSHLGCDEQMWDFEGKEGDDYAVQKLLTRHPEFFSDRRLGGDARLTVRGPNPDVQGADAKVLLEILESIPRSYDTAAAFARDRGLDPEPPIFEVIVPMVTSADQLNIVREYYRRFVAGKSREHVWGGRSVADWVGTFDPEEITVTPLVEDRERLLNAADITREYVREQGLDSQRVFLARSDPALNYGTISADLLDRIALVRLDEMAAEEGVEINPILGAGAAPFRGGLAPDTAADVAAAFPSVETFTAQSAFKYDHPVGTVRDGIEALVTAERGSPPGIDEERAIGVIDRTADAYGDQVNAVADLVNEVSDYVPDRRARKLHVGLFGYSREVGENALPRAITYTATLYSVGFPPEFMGVSGLTGDDIDFLADEHPRAFDLLRAAARYYNPRSLEVVDIDPGAAEAALELVDRDPDPDHRAATDDVLDAMAAGDTDAVRDAVREAARTRRFLG